MRNESAVAYNYTVHFKYSLQVEIMKASGVYSVILITILQSMG